MCVIICLKPNQKIPFDKFETACYNNEHGFGMVTKDEATGKLKVFKQLEYKVQNVYRLINKHKDKHRYIHLRWTTVGETSKENLHPFEVYKGRDNHVVFMHNGTLHRFKSKLPITDTKTSDSQFFAHKYLKPFISEVSSGSFAGYIGGVAAEMFFQEYWPSDNINRGILISEKEDTLLIAEKNWTVIPDEDDQEIIVSNDDYFDKLKRGTVYTQQQEEERKKREAEQKKLPFLGQNYQTNTSKVVHNLKDYSFGAVYELNTSDIDVLFNSYEIYDSDNLGLLAAVTKAEWIKLLEQDPDIAAPLLMMLASQVNYLEEEILEIKDKHHRATKKIAELAKEGK
jgi:predicted glutamine amidotransferase